jgi:hypothetical protein
MVNIFRFGLNLKIFEFCNLWYKLCVEFYEDIAFPREEPCKNSWFHVLSKYRAYNTRCSNVCHLVPNSIIPRFSRIRKTQPNT